MSNRNTVFVALCTLGLCAAGAMAVPSFSTVDGSLADWGVTLSVDGSNKFVPGGFTPTVGASTKQDNILNDRGVLYNQATNPTGFRDHGGEFCDVEALYAAFDSTYAYFAVVTSSDPNGISWDGYGSTRFGPGDLKVVVGSKTYGVGARPVNLTYYGSIPYGDANSSDVRNLVTWGDNTNTNPTPPAAASTFATTQAQVRDTPTWSHVDNPGPALDAYFLGGTGTKAGTGYAKAAWAKQSVSDTYYQDYWGHPQWRTYDTWVYEVAVLRTDIGMGAPGSVGFLSAFGVDCGNDILSMQITTEQGFVPEPMTMIFFGTGIAGVFGFVARRRMQKQA